MYNNLERAYVFLNLLKSKIVTDNKAISGVLCKQCEYKKGSELPKVDSTWFPVTDKYLYQGRDKHFWLHKVVSIDDSMVGKNVFLQIKTTIDGWDALNPQFLVYIDGVLVQGCDVNHTTVKLDANKKEFDLYLYMYTGVPNPDCFTGDYSPIEFICSLSIITVDKLCEKVYYDMNVLYDILSYSDENTLEYKNLLSALTDMMNIIDIKEIGSEEYYKSLEKCSEYADKEVYGKMCKDSYPKVICIGHTHIDIAWMWTVGQTREKVQRSFSTVISNMKRYSDFKFMSSQAILYEMIKQECPQLYEEIKKAVKEKRWEVEGSMWVEADCNLISGESLVRQVLYGKNFFKKEFGVDTKILWEPDVFGYSSAIPQILKKSGVDYFVTSKISWNDTNQMPYDVFLWRGIDGSEVFTYFLTAQEKKKGVKPINHTTYIGLGIPSNIAGTWDRLTQKELSDQAIITYGFGDGGGGPTAEHIEQIERMSKGLPNCPQTVFGTATEFLDRLYKNSINDKNLPIHDGELYLEFHRGTYTSQAKNKRNNRKAEFEYENVEFLSAMNSVLLKEKYPKEQLHEKWKKILTNQFHDIIPGSSIKEVYEDSDRDYKELFDYSNALTLEKTSSIMSHVGGQGNTIVFNPNSFKFSGEVKYNGKSYYVENIPSKGYKVIDLNEIKNSIKTHGKVFENDYYKITFNKNYEMKSILHKETGREIIKQGEVGNKLVVFEDLPAAFDAWELRDYHKEKSWRVDNVAKIETLFENERVGLLIERKFEKSVIKQTVYLYNNVDRIDFENDITWNTEHTCLKVYFPLDVNAKRASFDIQFGNVERVMTNNNSWETAQFESCAHKYVDVSEGDFGVSLLNDCKYGHDVKNGNMGLTLLKCPTYPDKDCDKGEHKFTYSLYAHNGNLYSSDTIKQAYYLNNPLKAYALPKERTSTLPEEFSFIEIDKENVVCETIKQAEKGENIVVRLYESKNSRTKTAIKFGIHVRKIYSCNLLEERISEIPIKGNGCEMEIKPFEIITLELFL